MNVERLQKKLYVNTWKALYLFFVFGVVAQMVRAHDS